jgi:hypothetical protein
MKETKQLQSSDFFDLLDNLLSQFLDTQSARCIGEDLGENISVNAKKYFSITIDQRELSDNLTMLGVLIDDFKFDKTRNGYTYAIFIDPIKIEGPLFNSFLIILLAHEICHFAFLYELFINYERDADIIIHNNFFKNISPSKNMDKIQSSSNYQDLFDAHNILNLIEHMGEINKEHFTKSLNSMINFESFFYDFIEHMNKFYESKNNKKQT